MSPFRAPGGTGRPVGEQLSGATLRRWRQGLELTQEELAALMGVTQTAVGHMETGATKITRRTIVQLRMIAELRKVDPPETRRI